jgi:uncharacterized protein YdhG (YjbR/CyaY superfamily)
VVQSKATTVEQYLKELPPERREVVAAVRRMVKKHLPKGYVEAMAFGMIGYGVPLARYPDTYNGQPLGYVAIAAQKNHYALYLMSVYADSAAERALRRAFAGAGKKLDMGKSCIRFKKLADLEMAALGRAIASTPVDEFIALYEASRKR